MSTKLPPKNDFELPPAGSHMAICYRVIDLGTQQYEWEGKKSFKPTIMLGFELCNEVMKDGRPFSVQQRFKLGSDKKAKIRIFLESWRGVPFSDDDFGNFDVAKLIRVPCLLGIIHTESSGNIYANINSVMKLPKGMTAPSLINEPIHLTFDEFDQEAFNKLSENMQAVIAKSPEYQELKGATHLEKSMGDASNGIHLDDEIPF